MALAKGLADLLIEVDGGVKQKYGHMFESGS